MFVHQRIGKRILGLVIILFLLIESISLAQRRRDDSSYYRTEPIPGHLQPIERASGSSALGSVYFYGRKKLSSPYSLEIPFYELNDPEINHRFQTFRTVTTIGRLVAIAPLAYILLANTQRRGTYWTVYGGSVAASLTLIIIGNSQVNKAVTRYNNLLRQPRVGFSATPVSITGQSAVGAGLAWSF